MSRYINFSTAQVPKYSELPSGVALHDGELPCSALGVAGVKIDGRPVEFEDDMLVDNLHRSLVEGTSLKENGAIYDCETFVALMRGLELKGRDINGYFPFDEEVSKVAVRPPGAYNTLPLSLGKLNRRGRYVYPHIVHPSHRDTGPSYIHKLGSGPVCISGLKDALKIYRCKVAHPVTSLFIRRPD